MIIGSGQHCWMVPNIYGTVKNIGHYINPFPIQSEIPGFYNVGASTSGHGVSAATRSGLIAAAKILKCPARSLLTQHTNNDGIVQKLKLQHC